MIKKIRSLYYLHDHLYQHPLPLLPLRIQIHYRQWTVSEEIQGEEYRAFEKGMVMGEIGRSKLVEGFFLYHLII